MRIENWELSHWSDLVLHSAKSFLRDSLVDVVEQNAEIFVRERLFDFRPGLVVILGCNPLLAQILALESEHEAIFASSRRWSADGGIQLEHLQVNKARLALR